MTPTELKDAIEIHGRRERVKASIAIRAATKVQDDCEGRLSTDPVLTKANELVRGQVKAEADGKAKALNAQARIHDERANVAKLGYFLNRPNVEGSDSEYAAQNQALAEAADQHGIAVDHWPLSV